MSHISKYALQECLRKGVDLNSLDQNGDTILHVICSGLDDEIQLQHVCSSLFEENNILDISDVEHVAHNINSVDWLSKNSGKNKDALEKVELLVNRGANVTIQNKMGKTALHIALAKNCKPIINKLLEKYDKVDLQDNLGQTALHVAVSSCDSSVALNLINKGANVNIKNIEGKVPLFRAIEYMLLCCSLLIVLRKNIFYFLSEIQKQCVLDSWKLVDILIDYNADTNLVKSKRKTPLQKVIEIFCKYPRNPFPFLFNGTVDLSKCKYSSMFLFNKQYQTSLTTMATFRRKYFYLITYEEYSTLLKLFAKDDSFSFCKNFGLTPLHIAALMDAEDNTKHIGILMDLGLSINISDNKNKTPLFYASLVGIRNNGSAVVKYLLDRHANPNLRDNKMKTALSVAIDECSICVSNEKHFNPNLFVSTNQYSIVMCILNSNVDVNIGDKNKTTPLHIACSHGNSIIADMLLSKGANINALDYNGRTPLHLAASSISNDVVNMLLDKNAILDKRDCEGKRPLHLLISHTTTEDNSVEVIQKIIDLGANVNAADKNGITPLHLATYYGHDLIFNILLKQQVLVNVQDKDGKTPLHLSLSIDINRSKYAIKLLDNGALASIKDANGQTPVGIAFSKGTFSNFIKHLIRLVYGKLHPHMELEVNDSLSQYGMSCNKECKKMMTFKFGAISLYDILAKFDIPGYVRNTAIELTMNNLDLEEEFPIYASVLKATFNRAKHRYDMLINATEIFSLLSHTGRNYTRTWSLLPNEIKFNILSNLNTGELRLLKEVVNSLKQDMSIN